MLKKIMKTDSLAKTFHFQRSSSTLSVLAVIFENNANFRFNWLYTETKYQYTYFRAVSNKNATKLRGYIHLWKVTCQQF